LIGAECSRRKLPEPGAVLDDGIHGFGSALDEKCGVRGCEPSAGDTTHAAELHSLASGIKTWLLFNRTRFHTKGIAMIDNQSTLLGRTEVAEGTMAFQFEKPNHFVFNAGQYIDLTLSGSHLGLPNGLTHTFSIASSPCDKELVVTTRMRDTVFKQAISILPIGSRARIEGPMGSFSLHKNTARPAIFLAGGIGIVPFFSMLSYATKEKLRHPIVLFYANRYLEDAAFIDELWKLERANPRFRFVPVLTRTDKNYRGWKGETGHISSEMLLTHVGLLRGPIYYIAGPPTMVTAVRRTLSEAGVDEDDIRTEEFAGY
jgi:ferredoxin-NADP reductase